MRVTIMIIREDPVNDDTVILDERLKIEIDEEMRDAVALGYKVQAALVRAQHNWIMDEHGQLTEKPLSQQV